MAKYLFVLADTGKNYRYLKNVREESGGKRADKNDVQKYMKKQEEPENTAMADALKKLFDK